ncbi:S9 family peptidase [Kitasatospora mediocidica]|uniref:S9 family peptidase n=1 Tax=Kitasatospora mediocidica TaxID=58352 RepID=UPI0005613413|nr:alpha/beta fold hydrolase [Kitasatospora mediocidica]
MIGDDRWRERFGTGRLQLPRYARLLPSRAVLLADHEGKPEVHTWDRADGARRRITDQPRGTVRYAIEPAGGQVWWFADPTGGGLGQWSRQPFEPEPSVEPGNSAAEPVGPVGQSAGLVLADDGYALAIAADGRTRVRTRTGRAGPACWSWPGDRQLAALAPDGSLLAVTDVGDLGPRRPDLRILDPADGAVLACRAATRTAAVHPLGFEPRPGATRLLLQREEEGAHRLLLWDVAADTVREIEHGLPGDLRAEWLPDASGVLVCHAREGRSRLAVVGLDGRVRAVPTPPGLVRDATARPDGSVEYLWSSARCPSEVRSTRDGLLYGGPRRPPGVPVEDIRVDGPGGEVHALLSAPAEPRREPGAAVFLLHGGPALHDTDSYNPLVSAWVDHGYTVVRVNYRGSTGYGRRWQDAARPQVGTPELEDVAAVREALCARGRVAPGRLVVGGSSWGGFLALLAVGREPEVWAAGFAVAPVADFTAAYAEQTDRLRALDRTLFGGTPEQVPHRYREASPITWADRVRAPLLLMAGSLDRRCPPAQIEDYAERVRAAGGHVELDRYAGGHEERRTAAQVARMERQLAFVRRHCPA